MVGKVKVAQSCQTLCHPMDYIQSMEFSKPEYWSGQLFTSPAVPKPRSPTLQVNSLPAEPPGKPNGGETAGQLNTNQNNQNQTGQ